MTVLHHCIHCIATLRLGEFKRFQTPVMWNVGVNPQFEQLVCKQSHRAPKEDIHIHIHIHIHRHTLAKETRINQQSENQRREKQLNPTIPPNRCETRTADSEQKVICEIVDKQATSTGKKK